MKFRDISISKGMTVNLGNHNFHKVEIGATVVFDETDDIEKGLEQVTNFVNLKLAQEITAMVDDKKVSSPKRQTLMETE